MKEFWKLIRQYVAPYKGYLFGSLAFNVLSAVLNVFSFVSIIPMLQLLFGIDTTQYSFIPWDAAGMSAKDIVVNNLYYYTTQLIADYGASTTLLVIGLFLAFATLLKTSCYFASVAMMVPLRTGIVRDIRDAIYGRITRLPLAFFSEERKGDIIARMSGDVGEIENSITGSLEMIIKNPILIVCYFGVLIYVSWQLTLFTIVVLPILGTAMGKIGRRLKQKSLEAQENWSDTMSQLEETLGGMRIIKAFTAEDKMRARFEGTTEAYRRTTGRVYTRQASAHPVSEFLGTCLIVLVLWYGGTLILGNSTGTAALLGIGGRGGAGIDAPTFIFYMVILYSIIQPLKDLSRASYAIPKGMASLQRVNKILDAENSICEQPDAAPIESLNEEIRFEGVSFSYGDGASRSEGDGGKSTVAEDKSNAAEGKSNSGEDKSNSAEGKSTAAEGQANSPAGRQVLINVTFTVRKGQTVALVGQSGSGKSTLVDLLPRFHDVSGGSITIDGRDIRTLRLSDLRSLIGNVNQEAILFNDSFFNNIAFGAPAPASAEEEKALRSRVIEAAKIANAHEFIMATEAGYDTPVGDRGCRLSGGQRQRISIARAILKNPDILILDEATSALDTESERLVQEALERLMKTRTTIAIAHRLSTIKGADEILVLHEGRIVERGTHDALIAHNGYYKRLHDLQM